jgi:hypothetical protein
MNKIKINRVKLYDKYMSWVNQVADDIPEKTHFDVDEIINAISRILESDTDIIQEFPDKIVREVVAKYKQRSDTGIKKYNTTLEENNTDNFLNHALEEAMDFTLYLMKIKNILEAKGYNKIEDLENLK